MAVLFRQGISEEFFQACPAEQPIDQRQSAYLGRTQHGLAGTRHRRGERRCRRGLCSRRARTFGRHGMGLLPCEASCRPPIRFFGHASRPTDRTTGGLSQEGNVQRGPKARAADTHDLTYEKSHQRKFFYPSVSRPTGHCLIARPSQQWLRKRLAKPPPYALCSHSCRPLQVNQSWKFTRYLERDVRKVSLKG